MGPAAGLAGELRLGLENIQRGLADIDVKGAARSFSRKSFVAWHEIFLLFYPEHMSDTASR